MTIKERLEEIKAQIAKLDKDRDQVVGAWAKEVKKATQDPKFDLFDKNAEKILIKISDKYTPMLVDIDDDRNELVEEHNFLLTRLKQILQSENNKKD